MKTNKLLTIIVALLATGIDTIQPLAQDGALNHRAHLVLISLHKR